MKLTLQRTHTLGPRTFGKLYADGRYLCHTLEDEIREQAGQPVADWKIKGATAIPSTTHTGQAYRVTLELSPRLSWSLRLDNGLRVELGRERTLNSADALMDEFVQFYPQLVGSRAVAPTVIDLRYPTGVAIRYPAGAASASTPSDRKGKS